MRIGLYGGSFNPPHLGHLNVVKQSAELLDLDYLVVMPAGIPYFKDQNDVEEKEHRHAMCKLAFDDCVDAMVSRIELDRPGNSYTIDTVRKIRNNVDDEIYLIVGTDAFSQLPEWHKSSELVDEVIFAVVPRDAGSMDGQGFVDDLEYFQSVIFMKEIRAVFLNFSTAISSNDTVYSRAMLSSTEVRRRISTGKPFEYLLPKKVSQYIKYYHLYGYGENHEL